MAPSGTPRLLLRHTRDLCLFNHPKAPHARQICEPRNGTDAARRPGRGGARAARAEGWSVVARRVLWRSSGRLYSSGVHERFGFKGYYGQLWQTRHDRNYTIIYTICLIFFEGLQGV